MYTKTWGSLAALAIGLAALPAQAADLGGNCCADLEERIAELEATTARKGNRKVSLEIYGQINQGVLYWDDGVEDDAYIVTNDNSRTRIGFRGKAKINSDLEAGYRLELGVRTANSKRFTQLNPDGNDNPLDIGVNDIRDSNWFLKSKTYGTVSVGRQATASDAITEINQTQTKEFSKYSDIEDTGLGLLLRSATNGGLTKEKLTPVGSATSSPGVSGMTWRRLLGDGGDQPGDGERRFNSVKYETPEYKGFTVSGAWGQDDFWDIAARYSGEISGFKVGAGIGYGEIKDGQFLQTGWVCNGRQDAPPGGPSTEQDCRQLGGSFSILHEDTGLFLSGATGIKFDDKFLQGQARFAGVDGVDDEQTFWAMQAGIERKFNDHGKTTIYGEYYSYNGGANSRRTIDDDDNLNPTGVDSAVWGTGVEMIGFGIAQGFDKAALLLYLSYRHVEGDLTVRQLNGGGQATGLISDAPLEDLDLVFAGGVIKF